MQTHPIARWHALVASQNAAGLADLLADDAVFHSPVVHQPQRGKALTAMYLGAAFQVFFGPDFRYVREIVGGRDAMLEFRTEIDGVVINGVDIIAWNDEGRICDFKVMIRPLKAIQLIHERMAAMLQRLAPGAAPSGASPWTAAPGGASQRSAASGGASPSAPTSADVSEPSAAQVTRA